ncbi:hypothetical protein ACWGKK_39740 [Streptomyces chartreusis]
MLIAAWQQFEACAPESLRLILQISGVDRLTSHLAGCGGGRAPVLVWSSSGIQIRFWRAASYRALRKWDLRMRIAEWLMLRISAVGDLGVHVAPEGHADDRLRDRGLFAQDVLKVGAEYGGLGLGEVSRRQERTEELRCGLFRAVTSARR